jgi:hypothetical protein
MEFYRIRICYNFSDTINSDINMNWIFKCGSDIQIRYLTDTNTNMDIFQILNKNIICIIEK